MLAPTAARAQPAAQPPADPAIGRAFGDYLKNPLENRDEIFEIARDGTANLSPGFLLALADAHLRSGRRAEAANVFREVLARAPDAPLAGWAHLGLGWIALTEGDVAAAREHYEQIASVGEWGSLTASTVLGLIAARDGATPEAISLLDQIAIAGATPPSLRMVARLGSAYARYWGRDYAAASIAFEAAAAEYPTGPLADDARYGAAWALYRGGDSEGALERLRALAGTEGNEGDIHVGRALVNLTPRAVFRTSLRRYREARIGPPHEQLLSLLDLDGAALARAALRRLDGDGEEEGQQREPTSAADRETPVPSATRESRMEPVASAEPRTSDVASAHSAGEARARPDAPHRERAWLALIAAAIAVALAVSVVVRAARRRPRST